MPNHNLPLVSCAQEALTEFRSLAPRQVAELSAAELMYERMRIHQFTTRGAVSPGGSCYLLPCLDAMLAINLPRSVDWEQIPAWLYLAGHTDTTAPQVIAQEDWQQLAGALVTLPAQALLQHASTLGLAISRADQLSAPPQDYARIIPYHHTTTRNQTHPTPLVLDLSSLWAGPLCSHLLGMAGFRVIKVESSKRPDGARAGNRFFYDLINQNKESIALDLSSPGGIQELKQLIGFADIVIEASRPAALKNMGIDAELRAASRTGLTWISITGHGRFGESAHRTGFGDDAAAAAGLSELMRQACGKYNFVGDAIADPLTGIFAALAGLKSYLRGGNELVALSLAETTAYAIHQCLQTDADAFFDSLRNWQHIGAHLTDAIPTATRRITSPGAELGEHSENIRNEFRLNGSAPHYS